MARRTPVRGAGDNATCVALDLGATTVRAVELSFNGTVDVDGNVRVVKRGSAPLPHGIWNDLSQQREALTAAIQQALSAGGISARTAVACLPRRLVTLRLVRLPHAPAEEMQGMVAFEAQQVVLYSLDEVILSYHVLPTNLGQAGTDSDMEPVLLAAARRTLVADVMASFDRAGIELQQLSVSALALAEHGRGWSEPTAVINVEAGELDIAVVVDRQPLFTRAASLDVQNATPDVTVRRALEETVRSLTAFQNEFRTVPLGEILLAGAGSATSTAGSLEYALKETLDMPVNPLVTRLLPMQDPDLRAYACAVGMGLQTRPESIAPINLVPTERAEMRAQKARGQRQAVAVAALILVAVGGIWAFAGNMSRQSKEQAVTLAANTKLMDLDGRLKKRQSQFNQVDKLANDLTTGLDRDHPAVDVLVALNAAMPTSKDIWLTQLSLNRGGTLTIRGDSKTPLMATDLVLALQASGAFTGVELNYLGDAPESDATAGSSTASAAGAATTALPGLAGEDSSTDAAAPAPPVSKGASKPTRPTGGPTTVVSHLPSGMRTAVLTTSRAVPPVRPGVGSPPKSGVPGSAGGNAVVPAISTPPGGIQSAGKSAKNAATDTPNPPRTLTSFVIICRINQQVHDLTTTVAAAKP